jgi:hypothetical protein
MSISTVDIDDVGMAHAIAAERTAKKVSPCSTTILKCCRAFSGKTG